MCKKYKSIDILKKHYTKCHSNNDAFDESKVTTIEIPTKKCRESAYDIYIKTYELNTLKITKTTSNHFINNKMEQLETIKQKELDNIKRNNEQMTKLQQLIDKKNNKLKELDNDHSQILKDAIHDIDTTDDSDDDNPACVKCWDAKPVMIAIPCGHQSYCGPCSQYIMGKNKKCLVCDRLVNQFIKPFKVVV